MTRSIDDLAPTLRPLCQTFLEQCKELGVCVFITQTYRSMDEQAHDYAQGRTLPGPIITHARPGQSKHNICRADGTPAAQAFDFAIKNNDGSLNWESTSAPWQTAIKIGKDLGLQWGGDFCNIKDCPHFELKTDYEKD